MALDLTPGQVSEPQAASAWIEPSGKWHFVPSCSHYFVAQALGYSGSDELEERGWVHFSFTGVHHERPLTQGQRDALWDTYQAFVALPVEERNSYYKEYLHHLTYKLDLNKPMAEPSFDEDDIWA